MNFFRKHEKLWKIIIVISSVALIASSLIPLFTLR